VAQGSPVRFAYSGKACPGVAPQKRKDEKMLTTASAIPANDIRRNVEDFILPLDKLERKGEKVLLLPFYKTSDYLVGRV
jgi:hypothetical protein